MQIKNNIIDLFVLAFMAFNLNMEASFKLNHIINYSGFVFNDLIKKKGETLKIKDAKKKIIAHAGGCFQGEDYSNSLGALSESYKKGFRIFELDIQITKDNVFVAVHNWIEWAKRNNYKGQLPPLLKDFIEHQKVSPLAMNDINKWFAKHPDAFLVTDKINEPQKFSDEFQFKNRLIMELFSIKAIKESLSLEIDFMASWSIFKGLSTQEILNIIKSNNIEKIVIHNSIYFRRPKLIKTLGSNIKLFSHGNYSDGYPRKIGVKNETYVMQNESNIFYGIYANNWNFK